MKYSLSFLLCWSFFQKKCFKLKNTIGIRMPKTLEQIIYYLNKEDLSIHSKAIYPTNKLFFGNLMILWVRIYQTWRNMNQNITKVLVTIWYKVINSARLKRLFQKEGKTQKQGKKLLKKTSLPQKANWCYLKRMMDRTAFNSAMYDITLIRSYLLTTLVNDRDNEPTVIKKPNQFVSPEFNNVQLLDNLNILEGAANRDSFLRAYWISVTKTITTRKVEVPR